MVRCVFVCGWGDVLKGVAHWVSWFVLGMALVYMSVGDGWFLVLLFGAGEFYLIW